MGSVPKTVQLALPFVLCRLPLFAGAKPANLLLLHPAYRRLFALDLRPLGWLRMLLAVLFLELVPSR
jgi:hypothetical protein